MFSIFNKKKQKQDNKDKNTFLEVENSVFHTEDITTTFEDNTNYSSFLNNPKDYSEVPKYKAVNNKNIPVVIDREQIGFNINDINKNIKTLELETSEEEERIDLEVDPITSETENNVPELKLGDIVEEIDLKNSEEPQKKEEKKDKKNIKLSLFGSQDNEKNKKQFSKDHHQEEKLELIGEVKFTKDGYKICPNCGAILNPDAPVCFMCSKNFVLKK